MAKILVAEDDSAVCAVSVIHRVISKPFMLNESCAAVNDALEA
jgi:hypothetical protein